MLHIQVSVGDARSHRVALGRGATMGELRRAVWGKTGVPWGEDWYGGKCQVLMLRGIPMPTNDYASVTASGLADGDVVQLVDDKTALKYGYTYLHCAAAYGVKEAVRALAEAADGLVDAKNIYQRTALHNPGKAAGQSIDQPLGETLGQPLGRLPIFQLNCPIGCKQTIRAEGSRHQRQGQNIAGTGVHPAF